MRRIIAILIVAFLHDFESITTINGGEVRYSFSYAIDVGNVVQHRWEERRGDFLRGSYSLLEPNGKVRVVQYEADDTQGFRTSVRHRNPPDSYRFDGPLMAPNEFQRPIQFHEPISSITIDNLQGPRTYPNLPD